jgi:uncharacterized protein YecE (DUF72 family)
MKGAVMSSDVRIGISGWRYAPWRKVFYPEKLVQAKELHFASRALPSIEINGSFYALQTPQRYASWYADTPEDFVFSVKAPRYITHILRLREPERAIANFFASGLFLLKQKLGPILWQFPPSFRFEPKLFESFLERLPHDTEGALALAKKREDKIKPNDWLEIDIPRPMRHAVEIRNQSFIDPAFVALLRQHRVALVIADTAGKWPYKEDLTADFVYMRLHGDAELYASGYSDVALDRWAERIAIWRDGGQPDDAALIDQNQAPPRRKHRDVFCYFDNDIKVKAPFDARKLLRRLELEHGLAELDWSKAV